MTLQTTFSKGIHKGKTLREVLDTDLNYVAFLLRKQIDWFKMDINAFDYYKELAKKETRIDFNYKRGV